MNEIGHNVPPDMAVAAQEAARNLSDWMSEHPVITTEEEAREAKLWADRAYLCVKDLEDERVTKVAPLNIQVKAINEHYKAPRLLLEGVLDELKSRIDRYLFAEESKRLAIAAEAKSLADKAAKAALLAEQRERQAHTEADSGVLGVDVAAEHAKVNQAYKDLDRAIRQAEFAGKETKVKVGGGFRRASSLRNTEVIYVSNAGQVLDEVGVTEGITAELLKAARAYKRLHGHYPNGITVTIERGI